MATPILEQQKLEALLRTPSATAPRRRRWMIPAAALIVLAAAAGIWRLTSAPKPAQFTTAPVRRQTIVKTISATGTLQAVTTVQVGTQVSGTISELYADFNSQVHKGQVIARLDPAQLQAQLAQANATWLSAQASQQAAQNNVLASDAGVQAAQANVDRADAAMKDAQTTADRTRKLVEAGVAPAMDLPTSQSTLAAVQCPEAAGHRTAQPGQSPGPGHALSSQSGAGTGRTGQSRRRPRPGESGSHRHPGTDRWRGGRA